jgi:hypothetical protein
MNEPKTGRKKAQESQNEGVKIVHTRQVKVPASAGHYFCAFGVLSWPPAFLE